MTEARDRYERIVPGRIEKAVKAIDVLANCARPRDYEFSEAEARALCLEIDEAVGRLFVAFGISELETDVTVEKSPEPDPDISLGESRALIVCGPKIDAAIDAIRDGEPDRARGLLLDVMTS